MKNKALVSSHPGARVLLITLWTEEPGALQLSKRAVVHAGHHLPGSHLPAQGLPLTQRPHQGGPKQPPLEILPSWFWTQNHGSASPSFPSNWRFPSWGHFATTALLRFRF